MPGAAGAGGAGRAGGALGGALGGAGALGVGGRGAVEVEDGAALSATIPKKTKEMNIRIQTNRKPEKKRIHQANTTSKHLKEQEKPSSQFVHVPMPEPLGTVISPALPWPKVLGPKRRA